MKRRFPFKGAIYEFELDLAPDTESSLQVGLAVRRQVSPREGFQELADVAVRLVGDEGAPILEVVINGETAYSRPLHDIVDSDDVVDAIPGALFGAGDPVTGCLIRAGISVSVRQIRECWSAVTPEVNQARLKARAKDEAAPAGLRFRLAARCLREHLPEMAFDTAFKAMRCIAGAGLA